MFQSLYHLISTLATAENDKSPEFMTEYYDIHIKVCEAYGLYVEAVQASNNENPDPDPEQAQTRRPCSVIGLFFPCIDPITEVFIFALIIIAAIAYWYFGVRGRYDLDESAYSTDDTDYTDYMDSGYD